MIRRKGVCNSLLEGCAGLIRARQINIRVAVTASELQSRGARGVRKCVTGLENATRIPVLPYPWDTLGPTLPPQHLGVTSASPFPDVSGRTYVCWLLRKWKLRRQQLYQRSRRRTRLFRRDVLKRSDSSSRRRAMLRGALRGDVCPAVHRYGQACSR